MTLQANLEAELDRLAVVSTVTGTRTIHVPADHGEVVADLAAVDRIGCSFHRLALATDRLGGATIDQLKTLSDNLCRRLNYLLEPIAPIEIDSEGCSVQMRSTPPQKNESGSSYYELLARRDGLTLFRYLKSPSSPRQRVAANVTREVFCRLAVDFDAAVA